MSIAMVWWNDSHYGGVDLRLRIEQVDERDSPSVMLADLTCELDAVEYTRFVTTPMREADHEAHRRPSRATGLMVRLRHAAWR